MDLVAAPSGHGLDRVQELSFRRLLRSALEEVQLEKERLHLEPIEHGLAVSVDESEALPVRISDRGQERV
jgi:hypothetical protein